MSEYWSLLFLGCDLVGSTAYKQREPDWPSAFLAFYRQFPQEVSRADDGSGLEFELWKAVGDELLFTVKVRSVDDIYNAVQIWLRAMAAYEKTLTSKGTGMALKGGAFAATFPGPDGLASVPRDPRFEDSDADFFDLNEAAIASQDTGRYMFDYFGPSIDTGFRVLSSATQRHFPMSVEVAWAFVDHVGVDEHKAEGLVHMGNWSFKGVWNGRDYPVFAVDRNFDDPVNTALRSLSPQAVNPTTVASVCAACCGSKGWPSAIYLPDATKKHFQKECPPAIRRAASLSGVSDDVTVAAESALGTDDVSADFVLPEPVETDASSDRATIDPH